MSGTTHCLSFSRACVRVSVCLCTAFCHSVHLLMDTWIVPIIDNRHCETCSNSLVCNSESQGNSVEEHMGIQLFRCHLLNYHRVSGAYRVPPPTSPGVCQAPVANPNLFPPYFPPSCSRWAQDYQDLKSLGHLAALRPWAHC